jgi:NADH:ubiquinone oxidoreductase subunit F (NADH-binding)
VTLLPRVLAGVDAPRRLSLAEHMAVHGPLPPFGPDAVLDRLAAAGLRGCGGAAFPTYRKWRAVRAAGGRGPVVVNGMEGEPLSRKDDLLLRCAPHLVLDGAQLAAEAIGAREVIVCVADRAGAPLRALDAAIAERKQGGRGTRIRVVVVPDRYVAGEERALVQHLNGGPAKPTFAPPRPFERGVRRRPTLVQNAETLAHAALVARHGPAWFREVGTTDEPGSRLVTLSGALPEPGVYEMSPGLGLDALLDVAGGMSEPPRAVLLGGYFGTWMDGARAAGLALEPATLGRAGASLGSGVVHVLPAWACGVAETARIGTWFARQSAGQCGPCVHGLAAIARLVVDIVDGTAPRDALARLGAWSADVAGRGACRHPDGAVRLLASALHVFGDELRDHAHNGRCPACDVSSLEHSARLIA